MTKPKKLFGAKLKVVNVGLKLFYEELKRQGVEVIHVNYQPRVKLEKELEEKLAKLL